MPKKSDRFPWGCSRWDGFYSGSKYSETASKETLTGQHTPEHEPQAEHDDWIQRGGEMTRVDKRLARLAAAWKQTITEAKQAVKQAVKQAKYEYQSQRGDLLHEVLLRNGGNREEAKAWAIENGSTEREAERLLKLEAELYAPYVPRPRKAVKKSRKKPEK